MRAVTLMLALVILAGAAPAEYEGVTLLPDETGFNHQPFTEDAFSRVPGWADAPDAYSIPSYQSFSKRYFFSDAVLVVEGYGTEGFVTTLMLLEPVSEEEALNYGRVMAGGDLPGFLEAGDEEIVYEYLSKYGSGSRVVLRLDGNGLVSEISSLEWSP